MQRSRLGGREEVVLEEDEVDDSGGASSPRRMTRRRSPDGIEFKHDIVEDDGRGAKTRHVVVTMMVNLSGSQRQAMKDAETHNRTCMPCAPSTSLTIALIAYGLDMK